MLLTHCAGKMKLVCRMEKSLSKMQMSLEVANRRFPFSQVSVGAFVSFYNPDKSSALFTILSLNSAACCASVFSFSEHISSKNTLNLLLLALTTRYVFHYL